MGASQSYPIYTVVAVAADGTKYELKNVTTDLMLEENSGELAQKASISLIDARVDGKLLSTLMSLKMRVFVQASDGKKSDEVFRGYVWDRTKSSGTENDIKIVAYDNLIYLQKSKDCLYFSSGKSTDSIVKSICSKWGIKLSYAFDSIKHSKLPLNNKYLSDMLIEVLDAVKNRKGVKYIIRSVKDILQVRKVGTNEEIYTFQQNGNVISVKQSSSLDGVITRVVIYGNEDDDERRAVAATVDGATSTYGTLQDVVLMSGNSTLSDAKTEANEIIKEKGKPSEENSVVLPDVPWVHKGDYINLYVHTLSGKYLVESVSHDAKNKTMSVEVVKAT